MTTTPTALRYIADHHWIAITAPGTIRVGVTDFAQESLGDVVAIYLPRLNQKVAAGQAIGEIESTKSVNDLVAPLAGTVSAVNERLDAAPELANEDPYGDGWLFEIDVDPQTIDDDFAGLLDADAYQQITGQ